jgi:transposase-like protein
MLHNPPCPTCGSERIALVPPGNAREFAYRCFTCGRRWRSLPSFRQERSPTVADKPLSKRMQNRLNQRERGRKTSKPK